MVLNRPYEVALDKERETFVIIAEPINCSIYEHFALVQPESPRVVASSDEARDRPRLAQHFCLFQDCSRRLSKWQMMAPRSAVSLWKPRQMGVSDRLNMHV